MTFYKPEKVQCPRCTAMAYLTTAGYVCGYCGWSEDAPTIFGFPKQNTTINVQVNHSTGGCNKNKESEAEQ